MPAIQPDLLQRQIDELLGQANEPSAFIRTAINLLDHYADRTKRPRSSAVKVEIAKVLRVPRPVMKMLCMRLQLAPTRLSEEWFEIGSGLWGHATREARQLAACVLNKCPEDQVESLVESWVVACEDDEAIEYLALEGLKAWRVQDLERFYRTIVSWLGDGRLRMRFMGILAFYGRSQDEDFNELPRMLSILSGTSAEVRGSSQRALSNLIRSLAEISPPEVAKFLIDDLRSKTPGAQRLAQASLSVFPVRLQHEIQAVMD
jgi:hypothetical protein